MSEKIVQLNEEVIRQLDMSEMSSVRAIAAAITAAISLRDLEMLPSEFLGCI